MANVVEVVLEALAENRPVLMRYETPLRDGSGSIVRNRRVLPYAAAECNDGSILFKGYDSFRKAVRSFKANRVVDIHLDGEAVDAQDVWRKLLGVEDDERSVVFPGPACSRRAQFSAP